MVGSNESQPPPPADGLEEAFIRSNCCNVSMSCGGVAGVLVGTACWEREGGREGEGGWKSDQR